MSKTRSDPNMTLIFLVEAATEFDGFVMGVGGANDYMTFSKQSDISLFSKEAYRQPEFTKTDDFSKVKEDIRKYMISKILDNAAGAFYTKDIIANPFVFVKSTDHAKWDLENYIVFLVEPTTNTSGSPFNMACFFI